jgi:hypothetical protein
VLGELCVANEPPTFRLDLDRRASEIWYLAELAPHFGGLIEQHSKHLLYVVTTLSDQIAQDAKRGIGKRMYREAILVAEPKTNGTVELSLSGIKLGDVLSHWRGPLCLASQ